VPADVRTIQRIVRTVRSPDLSGSWTLAQASPDEARAVLPVLALVLERGYVDRLTLDEASWIYKLALIARDLPLQRLWLAATSYRVRVAHKLPTGDLDAFLAFAPWRGHEDQRRYWRLVVERKVQRPPLYLLQDADDGWANRMAQQLPETQRWMEELEMRAWEWKMLREAEEEASRWREQQELLKLADEGDQ
jgi:hypothetical protein